MIASQNPLRRRASGALAAFALGCSFLHGQTASNDHFSARSDRIRPSFTHSSLLSGASVEVGEPSHAGKNVTRSLWWSWTASYTGWANFTVSGGGPKILAIYTGDSLETLSCVGAVSGIDGFLGVQRIPGDTLNIPVERDVTYHIAIADGRTVSDAALDRVILDVNKTPVIRTPSLIRGTVGTSLWLDHGATHAPTLFEAESLPNALMLNRYTGAIDGIPRSAGIFDAILSATNPAGVSEAPVRFVIDPENRERDAPKFNYVSLSVFGVVGMPAGNGVYTLDAYREASFEGLPPGMFFLPRSSRPTSLEIAGTPATAGTFRATARVENTRGAREAVSTFVIRENPPPPILRSASSAYARVGESFSYSLFVSNATGVTYTVGPLPDGLAADRGMIFGTPRVPGVFEISVTAASSGAATAATLTLTIAPSEEPVAKRPPRILGPSSILLTTVDPSSFSFDAGDATSRFSAIGLPPGLSIHPTTGAISGRARQSGIFRATITATNALGSDSRDVTISIRNRFQLSLTSQAVAQGVVGKAFSYTLTAGLQSTTPLDFLVPFYQAPPAPTFHAGSLPPGLTFQIMPDRMGGSRDWTTGVVSGTPTRSGTYRLPVSATWDGVTTQGTLTVVIHASEPTVAIPPVISSAASTQGAVGSAFSYSISAQNGATGITVTDLPPGLSFDPTYRTIKGTPTQSGTFVATVAASNAAGATSAKITILIEEALPGRFGGQSVLSGVLARSFMETLGYSGPAAEFSATGLPPGLHIALSPPQITGIPTTAGTFEATITASRIGFPPLRTYRTIIVRPIASPVITSSLFREATRGEPFSYTLAATNFPSSYAIKGTLPPGLTVSGNTLSGTPTASGTWELTLSATNVTDTATGSLTIRVVPPTAPSPATPAGDRAYLGKPFSRNFGTSGPPTDWQIRGRLPAGVRADGSGLAGTPTQTGTFPLQVTAIGPHGSTTAPYQLVVDASEPPPTILNPTIIYHPPRGSTTISATNSPTSTGATNLPMGLAISPSRHVITGTLADAETHSAWLTASNASGSRHAIVRFTNDTRLASGFGRAMIVASVNGSVSYRFYNGTEPYMADRVYSAADLPPGLSIDPLTSAITGPVNTGPGIHYITIFARHATHPEVVGTLTLVVEENAESPLVTSSGILKGSLGSPFSASLRSTPQADRYIVESLPPGIFYDETSQRLTGTPTMAGDFPIKITSFSAAGSTTVDAKISISDTTLPVPYFAAGFDASVGRSVTFGLGASNGPVTWAADILPPGLVFDNESIRGVPTSAGRFVVNLRATNAAGTTHSKLTINVRDLEPPNFSSSAVASGEVGNPFNYSPNVSNGSIRYTASNLPDGLTLNPSTGAVSGVPTRAGEFVVEIAASNEVGSVTARIVITISPQQRPILSSPASARGTVGDHFSWNLYTSRSRGTITVGELPPGLEFIGSAITGIPTESGDFTVPVRIVNGPVETSASLFLSIASEPFAPPQIDTWLTTSSRAFGLFRHDLRVANAPDSVTASGLPPGFAFDREGGAISGYPGEPMTTAVEVRAANALGEASAIVTLTAFDESSILSMAHSATAVAGEPFSYFFPRATIPNSSIFFSPYDNDGSGRNAPPFTVVARGLPPGLFYNATTQTIEGTPTRTGDYEVTFVLSEGGTDRTSGMTLHVGESDIPPIGTLRMSALNPLTSFGAVGSPFNLQIWPSGFASKVQTSELPAGLVLRTTPGVTNGILTTVAKIEGVPTKPGVFPVKVTFSNADHSDSTIVTIHVPDTPLAPEILGSSVARGTVGREFRYRIWENTSYQNAATEIQAGDLPPGIAFDKVNATFTGVPGAAGIHVVPVRFTNAGGSIDVFPTLEFEDPSHPILVTEIDGVESEMPAVVLAYHGRDFSLNLRSISPLDDLSVTGLPAGFGYHVVRDEEGAREIRIYGPADLIGRIPVTIQAVEGGEVVEIPLTIDVRGVDSWQDPEMPTPTPQIAKRAVLHLRSRKIETTSPSVTIRGRLAPYTRGMVALHAKRPDGHRGWKAVRVRPSGKFHLRIRDLVEDGRRVVVLRMTQPHGRTSHRVTIHRL